MAIGSFFPTEGLIIIFIIFHSYLWDMNTGVEHYSYIQMLMLRPNPVLENDSALLRICKSNYSIFNLTSLNVIVTPTTSTQFQRQSQRKGRARTGQLSRVH